MTFLLFKRATPSRKELDAYVRHTGRASKDDPCEQGKHTGTNENNERVNLKKKKKSLNKLNEYLEMTTLQNIRTLQWSIVKRLIVAAQYSTTTSWSEDTINYKNLKIVSVMKLAEQSFNWKVLTGHLCTSTFPHSGHCLFCVYSMFFLSHARYVIHWNIIRIKRLITI